MNRVLNRPIIQNTWVSDDIESLARKWAAEMQVGPFFHMELEVADFLYRGEPSELRMKVAIAQAGAMQIELIQPLSDAPNAYRDSVKAGETGFHHMCIWSNNLQEDISYFNGLGYATAQQGDVGLANFAYVDTRPFLGCMLEIVEQTPAIAALFGTIAGACSAWDGTESWRGMESLQG